MPLYKLRLAPTDDHQLSSSIICLFPSGCEEATKELESIKCQKILKCGDECQGLATKGNHIAVGVPHSIEVYDRSSNKLLHTIGNGQLGRYLSGVTFYDQENILVADRGNSNTHKLTSQPV